MQRILWCFIFYWFSMLVYGQVPASIDQIIAEQRVNKENLSLVVQDVSRNEPLVSLNADVLRSPASVTKLLTTASALIRMGKDYQWETNFYVDHMPDASGVVQGNLYIQGGGDPFLVEERLEEMLKSLRQKGVRHITGDIVLDSSLYHLPLEARNTEVFDGNRWSSYNAVPNPLMVNFSTIKIRLTPQGEQAVKIDLWPNIMSWKIDNNLSINAKLCRHNYAPVLDFERTDKGYAEITLNGKYSTNCGPREMTVVVGEGSEQFYYLFHDLWYRIGGSFDGGGQINRVPSNARLIYSGKSLPLSEQIQKMNQMSNNVMTRQLMLTLGVHIYGMPGSLEKGRQAVTETLSSLGVSMKNVYVDNGSGLSRKTQMSAQVLATLLLKMYASDDVYPFMESLAIAGEEGTLRKRFRGESMQGKVIGKTGTLDGVRAFAGYVHAESGHNYVVVIIGNGKDAVRSRYVQDDILKWVYKQ